MADISRSVRGRKHPRNPGQVDLVTAFPTTNDQYVKTLLHFNGTDGSTTIIDDIEGKTWSATGDAQIDTFTSRFGGSSVVFDGTGDYITGNGSSDYAFGTGDFTIELWMKANVVGALDSAILDFRPNGTNGQYPHIYWNNVDRKLHYWVDSDDRIVSDTALVDKTWYHVVIARSGTSTKLFINGIQEGVTYTDNNNYLVGTNRPMFGSNGVIPGNYNFNGWIDELRISKGIARWTSNFVPPAYAYGSLSRLDDSYTKALIHFNGTDAHKDFFDESGRIWNAYGDAQIETAQSKFGSGCGLFDGNGDYLLCDGSSDFAFGTGDFTIDFWVKITESIAGSNRIFYDSRPNGDSTVYPNVHINGNTMCLFYYVNNGYQIEGTNALSLNVWYHVAVARSGTNTKMFLNGQQDGSTFAGDNLNYLNAANRPSLMNGWDLSTFSVPGVIDELRVSKGIARWTANFTPQATEYAPS